MRFPALLALSACLGGENVKDPQCRRLDDVPACTQCCLDQGYTDQVQVEPGECICSRMDVGDDPGEADLRD